MDPQLIKLLLLHQELDEVKMSWSDITDKDLVIFTKLVLVGRLILNHNRITHLGAITLARLNYPINTMVLSGNDIGDMGAEALAKSIHPIYSLFIDHNNITDVGAKALSQSDHPFHILNLSHNKISNIGAISMSTSGHQIHTLDLSFNQITDIGIVALSKSIHPIQYLFLYGCNISYNGAKSFLSNSTILRLRLDDCPHNVGIHIQNNRRRRSLQHLAGEKVMTKDINNIPHALREFIHRDNIPLDKYTKIRIIVPR